MHCAPFYNFTELCSLVVCRQRYEAGIYLLLAYSVRIPGNSVSKYSTIILCHIYSLLSTTYHEFSSSNPTKFMQIHVFHLNRFMYITSDNNDDDDDDFFFFRCFCRHIMPV